MSASTDIVAGLDLGKLTPKQIAYLDWQTRWIETARLEQLPPDPDEQAEWLRRVRLVENAEGVKCDAAGQPWSELGVMAGRGFGKTRVGAEWLGRIAYDGPADGYYAVVAPTQSDVRFTCFEGESGLLNVIPKQLIAKYNSSDLILSLVNGAQMRGFSAEKAERLRGPQYHGAWCDELAAWGKDAQYTWDMLMFGLRLGQFPRVMWTTTPKPVPLVRDLIVPKEGRIVVAGATFDNRKNLPKVFFDKLKVYEGTKIGRQELYGEMIDPEEAGIVRRSWINLWPANKPLPKLDFVVMSLDTAFTEETRDKKSGDADPTACGVWGVFYIKSVAHMILLDCWEERLGFPDLVKRVKKELKTAYGDDEDAAVIKPMFGNSKPLTSGRKPDMLLIEDKGSGISLRQTLIAAGLEAFAYNPGRADKLSRLHIVSPIFAQRRVWVPESQKFPGKPRTWCEPLIGQLCSFTGEGSIKHDDHVDQTTQAFRVLMDKGLVSMVRPTFEQKRLAEAAAAKPKDTSNPYAA